MEKINKIIIFLGIICFPILLNFILRIPVVSVIGGTESETVWLGFWASYGGAILGGLISLYILKATINFNKLENKRDRDYNHEKFLFEQRKTDLDKEIERLNLYLQIFDFNKLKFIYNVKLKEKSRENESLHMFGNLYNMAFERFHQFSVYYTDEEFSTNSFLSQQGTNYLNYICLLDDVQVLIGINPDNWTNLELQTQNIERFVKENNLQMHRLKDALRKSYINKHNILINLLEQYKEIQQSIILTQIREYINNRKEQINKAFNYKYGIPQDEKF